MNSAVYNGPQNQLAIVLENRSEKIHDYGLGNTLPNVWMNAVYDSGTATRCVAKTAEFIQADGFVDKTTAEFIVNPKQTADDLLSEIAGYLALNVGFALIVKRQLGEVGKVGSNKVAEAYCLPFETVRVGLDGRYQVNPTYGKHLSEYKRNAFKWFPAFNAKETPEQTQAIIAEQTADKKHGGYAGNVLYVFEKGPGKNIYPIPEAYSGLEDILSDASLSSFEWENLENGFFPSAMLFTQGQLDDKTIGQDGKTDWERFSDNLKTFQGRKNRSKLFHAEYGSQESKPELVQFDIKAVLDGLDGITDRIFRKVCRHMGVPSVLIEPNDSALGNGGLLLNAIQLFQTGVNRKQRMAQRNLTMLFPELDWSISTLNLISYLPDKVLDLMSKEQILKMYGIAEEEPANVAPTPQPGIAPTPTLIKAA